MVRTYLKKHAYAVNERILVHLSERADVLSPDLRALTQEGIAASIACSRATASKRLVALQRRGLVAGSRRHVPGFPVRKTTYGLTAKGRQAAASVRRRLAWDAVRVRRLDAGEEEMTVASIPTKAGAPVDLATAMSLISKGRLDLAALVSVERSAERAGIWGEPARPPDRLFGRGRELKALDGWLASSTSLLFVTGLAGIGKSALVSHWVIDRRPRPHVFWHALDASSSLIQIASDLGTFLATLGRRGLSAYLVHADRGDARILGNLVRHEMRGVPTLFVFDDLEKVPTDVTRDLLGLLGSLADGSRTKAIVITRHAPRAPDGTVLRVPGLDVEASLALLRHRGRTGAASDLEVMATAARGHPFLLRLLAVGGAGPERTVERYLEAELWGALRPHERRALETASILRRPVPPNAILRIEGVGEAALTRLLEMNLIEPTVSGALTVHNVIRDFVRGRISRVRESFLHATAADHFLRETGSAARIDALFHLVRANRIRDAAVLLDREGALLIDSSSAEEVGGVLQSIVLRDVDPFADCVFTELRGDSLRVRGDMGPALFQYRRALALSESAGDVRRMPRLIRKIAFIERCRTNYAKALGLLVEADARLGRNRDEREEAEVLKELALVEQAQGNLSGAARHLTTAIDLATEASDPAALVRSLLGLASLEAQRGNRQRGLDLGMEARRIAERSRNPTEAARAWIVLGTILADMGRFHESLAHHEHGLELAREVGNVRLIAYATMNRTAALLDLERYEDAAPPLQEAKQLFGVLEEHDSVAMLLIYEGERAIGLGQAERARRIWRRGLELLQRVASETDFARALKHVGTQLVASGDVGAGQGYLHDAAQIARRLESEALLQEIEKQLDALAGGASLLREGPSDGPP